MTNFFDKLKEDIYTGAESGYFGATEKELTEVEIMEAFDESEKHFGELALAIAAEPHAMLKDAEEIITAEKIIMAGGEAASESLKQKGYAVKRIANRSVAKVLSALKGLMGWFTGSSADFKKLSTDAKALKKRLDKVVLPAENDDNKIEIPKFNLTAIKEVVTRATGNAGRFSTTVETDKVDSAIQTCLVSLNDAILRVDKDEALVGASNINNIAQKIKTFNEGNYIDEVKDYLDSIKTDDTEELTPNGALAKIKTLLGDVEKDCNFTNKSIKDITKLIGNIEKLDKKVKDETKTVKNKTGVPASDNAQAAIAQAVTGFASAVITFRKSALMGAKFARAEYNKVITEGTRIESMGKKTK